MLAGSTRSTREAQLIQPGRNPALAEERAAGNSLAGETMDRLPRYEAHLSRELDRALARYDRLQAARRQLEPRGVAGGL